MRNKINILLIILFFPIIGIAQETDEDSLWNLDDLDYEMLEKQQQNVFEESHGWFPKSSSNMYSYGFAWYAGDNFDIANKILPKGFGQTFGKYSNYNFLSDDEMEMREKNSNDEITGYPETDFDRYSFEFKYYPPFVPLNIFTRAAITDNESMLFSHEKPKKFMSYSSKPTSFNEAGIMYLDEWQLNTCIGLELPFYGAFMKTPMGLLHSYYYVSSALSFDYLFSSEATQYLQILTSKNDLRYFNGTDTTNILYEVDMKDINRLRYSLDISIGFQFTAGKFTFNPEIYTSFQLNSVVTDAIWKHHRLAFKINLGYTDIFFKNDGLGFLK